jgi:hypothetical protein
VFVDAFPVSAEFAGGLAVRLLLLKRRSAGPVDPRGRHARPCRWRQAQPRARIDWASFQILVMCVIFGPSNVMA